MKNNIEERALVLAPRGRDAVVAKRILRDGGIHAEICVDLAELVARLNEGAGVAVVTEEALNSSDLRALAGWVAGQPAWSDFHFVALTRHGGGIERAPAAARLTNVLRNVSFLERPFHATTLISAVQTGLYGRQRQYQLRRLNEELEMRVQERTAELAAANRQLVAQMEERERVESTLRQMQRLEAVGQLTAGVAHDFNNLLTVVLGNLTFLERGLLLAGADSKLMRRLENMRMAAERGAKLTDQLLSFSRRQRLEPRAADVNATIGSMSELLRSTIGSRTNIEIELTDGIWPALVDTTQLELAVLNLAINARDAMNGEGTLTIRSGNVRVGPPLRPEEPPEGEYVMIAVVDNGSGMTEAVRSKALEPFFTTKGPGRGSGLGLSQVLGFAKQSGGGIRIDTRVNEGTTISIYLPRAQSGTIEQLAPRSASEAALEEESTILLVDDDAAVREITASILADNGFQVLEAGSGGAALEALEQSDTIDLVLVDFAMPGMNGAELAQHVQARWPTLPILFVTGFADRTALAGVRESHIIGKPFLDNELIDKVRGALAQQGVQNVVQLRR